MVRLKIGHTEYSVKVMDTPEKIYVHEASAQELTENLPYHVEYTRTDFFVEKATKLFEENLKNLGFLKDERESMVNMFKKAMNDENDND